MNYQNQNYNEILLDIAKKGDRLVAFAGTGVVSSTGIPLWEELLEKLENQTQKKIFPRRDGEIIIDDYAKSAQDIYDNLIEIMGKDEGEKCYKKTIDDLIATKHWDYGPAQINIIHTCKRIVTTNFEKSFEEARADYFRFKNKTPTPLQPQVYPNLRPYDFPPTKEGLVYLHGIKSDHIILKTTDYQNAYISSRRLIDFYKYLYQECNLLFIGFSFKDAYVIDAFELIRKEIEFSDEISAQETSSAIRYSDQVKHYAFLENEGECLRQQIKQLEKDSENPIRKPDSYKREIERSKNELEKFESLLKNLEKLKIEPLLYSKHKDYRRWLNEIEHIRRETIQTPIAPLQRSYKA